MKDLKKSRKKKAPFAVATLMLMKDLKKSRKKKAPFAWVRNLYKEREKKKKALTICLLGKMKFKNTTSGELLN